MTTSTQSSKGKEEKEGKERAERYGRKTPQSGKSKEEMTADHQTVYPVEDLDLERVSSYLNLVHFCVALESKRIHFSI